MKHVLRNTEEDQTREVRELIKSNTDIEFEGHAYTHGMLPEDLSKEYFNGDGQSLGFVGDVGYGKILPVHGITNFTMIGGSFENRYYPFAYDAEFPRKHHITGELSFLDIKNSSNLEFIGTKFKGHLNLFYPDGKAKFSSKYEYDHGIEIRENSKNIYFEGIDFSHLPGDLIYLGKGVGEAPEYITMVNCTIRSNGRQGAAPSHCSKVHFKRLRVVDSARGGDDVEPPKPNYYVIDHVVEDSWLTSRLLGFPMGGSGTVDGLKVKDTVLETFSPSMLCLADRVNSFRKNITFQGNRRLNGWGSSHGCYSLTGAQGVDINNEHTYLKEGRGGVAVEFNYCQNVVVRNSNFINGEFIVLRDTPIEEVKVYGNHTKLKFKIYEYDVPRVDAPDYLWHRQEYGRHGNESWQAAMAEYEAYMADRESRATFRIEDIVEYDADKNGEDFGIRVPDFKPYLGKKGVAVPNMEWEEKPMINMTQEIDYSKLDQFFNNEEMFFDYVQSLIPHEAKETLSFEPSVFDIMNNFRELGSIVIEVKAKSVYYQISFIVDNWEKTEPIPVEETPEPIEEIEVEEPVVVVPEPIEEFPEVIEHPEPIQKESFIKKNYKWLIPAVILLIATIAILF